MATGIVTVGRRQYASGLYWENSPSGRISQAAKEAARQPGASADFYATRSGNKQGRVPQFGLAPATEGFRAGVPSLAGCLANQQPGSWIGAFRLREGTALVVVRDDLIVPDGDLFFLDESEARDHLYQEMAVGGFQRIYAPEPWGVPGADTMPISLLLNERTDVKLHTVTLSKQARMVLGIGFGLLLVIVAVGWYIQYKEAEEEELRRQKMEAIEKMKEQARNMLPVDQKPNYPPPERKWESQPLPLEVIEACRKSFEKVNVAVAGWSITGASCSTSSLTVNWARRGGFSRPPEGAIVAETGEVATLSVSFDALKPRGTEQLMDPDVITRRYLSQNWTGSIRRESDDPPPPPPPGHKGEWNPPPPPWVKRSFTFTVPVLPWQLPVFWEGIPGVVVRSVVHTGDLAHSRNSWKVEGVIYENRR